VTEDHDGDDEAPVIGKGASVMDGIKTARQRVEALQAQLGAIERRPMDRRYRKAQMRSTFRPWPSVAGHPFDH